MFTLDKDIPRNTNPHMARILDIAAKELGPKESPGPYLANSSIIKYLRTTPGGLTFDDIVWAASFVKWCIEQAGYTAKSTTARARSFLTWGLESDGRIGDVVVFWSDFLTGSNGHVGFVVGRKDDTVYVLGGNHKDAVTIAPYDIDKVLGYRRIGHGKVYFDLSAYDDSHKERTSKFYA